VGGSTPRLSDNVGTITRSIRAWEDASRLIATPLDLWQLADVPVTAESLDEQDAGVELSAPDIDVILFVAKSRRL
jgi:hypothetical protein